MTQDNSTAQLVERLRAPAFWFCESDEGHPGDATALVHEAADLIERLTRLQPSTGLDMGALSGSRASAEPVSRLGPTGFDPSRLMRVISKIAADMAELSSDFAYGAWNPHFCSQDASGRAVEVFADLRREIDHYAKQAAIAMQARQGGDGETRLDPKDDSAGGEAVSPETPQGDSTK